MTDDAGGCRRLLRMWAPRTWLLAIVIGIALLTVACSGGSSTSPVASLGGSGNSAGHGNGGGSSATAQPRGNPTQLLDEWASCMRGHGDPGTDGVSKFPDLTVDSDGGIHLGLTSAITNDPAFQGATVLCAKKIGVKGIGAGIDTTRPGAIVYGNSGADA
jgi:hypothetical protein